MPPLSSILSQHLEEASFQWLLRDLAVWEPHYSLKDLADLDERVEAHLDGLRIGGTQGWEAIADELTWEEPGEVFAATVAVLDQSNEELFAEVQERLAANPALAKGAISAFGWRETGSGPHLEALLTSEDPTLRSVGIGGAAVNRRDPGEALVRAIEGSDLIPRRRALKAAGELDRTDLLRACQAHYESDDPGSAFWAAHSGALLGDRDGAPRTLYHVSLVAGPHRARAADLVARIMPSDRVLAWHRNLAAEAETIRLGCIVARALGDPALVPWLLEVMANEEHARISGEAWSTLTGVDLAYDDLDQDAPPGFVSGPSDDPADEDVSTDADEELPWPDPALLARWWTEKGSAFSPGIRYLGGRPMSPEACGSALRDGKQRNRIAASLELTLQQPGTPLFEVRARGTVQQAWLGQR